MASTFQTQIKFDSGHVTIATDRQPTREAAIRATEVFMRANGIKPRPFDVVEVSEQPSDNGALAFYGHAGAYSGD